MEQLGRLPLFLCSSKIFGKCNSGILASNPFSQRHLVFYPILALMVLFFNILRDPLHEHAANGLEIISLTRDVIKSMPESKSRPQDARNLGRLDKLIAELGRLAQCAVAKAKATGLA